MLPRRSIAAAPLVLAVALGCATPRTTPPVRPNVARAPFAPGTVEAVFGRAVRAVRDAGYRIVTCDPERSLIETSAIEFDARCGGTTCLSRQVIEVKLGYRRARITVAREIYDGAGRAWLDDAESAGTVARAIAQELATSGAAGEPLADDESDPCAAGERRNLSAAWTPPAR